MPRPKTKKELLELGEKNYNLLISKVKTLDEKEILKPRPGKLYNASIKDDLAHLHEWHMMMLGWYKSGMKGNKPEMPAPGYTWKELPKLNTAIYKKYKKESLRKVLSSLNSSYKKLRSVIQKHSDKELFTKKMYPWTGSTSLGSYLISATSSHYDWTLKQIKKYGV